MNFLKTLFWIAITIVAVVFATNNWSTVTLNLWGGLQADAKLPILLLVAFLIGFLPTWLWHRARLWHVRRQSPVILPVTGPAAPPAATSYPPHTVHPPSAAIDPVAPPAVSAGRPFSPDTMI